VSTCAGVPLAAAERFVQPVDLARVRSRDDESVRVDTILRRRADVRLHLFWIHQSLSGDMSAALRGLLVFEEYGLGPESLVEIDGVDDGFHVSIPVVAIDQYGQIAGCHDVANARANLSQRQQADAGKPEPCTDQGKAP